VTKKSCCVNLILVVLIAIGRQSAVAQVMDALKPPERAIQAAAEEGKPEAQLQLGRLYLDGLAVPRDRSMAYLWFNIAAANGSKAALTERDKLEKLIPPAQVALAEAMSREWKPKEPLETPALREMFFDELRTQLVLSETGFKSERTVKKPPLTPNDMNDRWETKVHFPGASSQLCDVEASKRYLETRQLVEALAKEEGATFRQVSTVDDVAQFSCKVFDSKDLARGQALFALISRQVWDRLPPDWVKIQDDTVLSDVYSESTTVEFGSGSVDGPSLDLTLNISHAFKSIEPEVQIYMTVKAKVGFPALTGQDKVFKDWKAAVSMTYKDNPVATKRESQKLQAELLFNLGRYKEALDIYEELKSPRTDGVLKQTKDLVEEANKDLEKYKGINGIAAESLYELGRHDEALTRINAAILEPGNDGIDYSRRGEIYGARGDLILALQDFDKANTLMDRKEARYLPFRRAILLYMNNKQAEAQQACVEALGLANSAEIYSRRKICGIMGFDPKAAALEIMAVSATLGSNFGPTTSPSIQTEIDAIQRGGRYTALPKVVAEVRRDVPPGMCMQTVENRTAYSLTLLFGGPSEREVTIPAGSQQQIQLPIGLYKMVGRVPGNVLPYFGEQRCDSGMGYPSKFEIQ